MGVWTEQLKVWRTGLAIAVVATMLTGCAATGGDRSAVASAGVSVGQLKGYKNVNAQVRTRLFEPASATNVQLSALLPGGSSLQTYMGAFSAGDGELINATPNAVNTMLWDLALTALGDRISQLCATPSSNTIALPGAQAVLKTDLAAALHGLCADGLAGSSDAALDLIWTRVIAFDGTDEEEQAWMAFAKQSAPVAADKKPWIRGILRAMFLNPYFLIAQ